MKTTKDRKTERKLSRAALIALVAAAGALFTFCVYKVAGIVMEYKKGQDAYASIKASAVQEAAPEDTDGDEDALIVDFTELRSINPDCVGWIQIPGGSVNYPVVQSYDNDYYLRRTFEGESYIGGVIFLDYRSSAAMTDKNTVVYGHHMNDGTMFAELASYIGQSYRDGHPRIYFYTPSSLLVYEVFSACHTDILNECYTREFSSDDAFVSWGLRMRAQSAWDSQTPVTAADTVLTLSTCTNVVKSERYVVQAVLVERRELPRP